VNTSGLRVRLFMSRSGTALSICSCHSGCLLPAVRGVMGVQDSGGRAGMAGKTWAGKLACWRQTCKQVTAGQVGTFGHGDGARDWYISNVMLCRGVPAGCSEGVFQRDALKGSSNVML